MRLIIILFTILIYTKLTYSQTTFSEQATSWGIDLGGENDGGHSFADFDGDGDLDLLVNTENATQKSRLYRNNGNNTFTDVTSSLAPALLINELERCAVWGDLNNDGRLDFIRNTGSGGAQKIEIYLQASNGNFGDGTGGTTPIYCGQDSNDDVYIDDGLNSEGAGLLDFDGDGDLDIIFDNHNYGIDILRNNYINHTNNAVVNPSAINLFTQATPGTSTILGLAQSAIDGDYGSFTDVNNDGWVDIFMRKQNENDFFLNQGGTFTNGADLAEAFNYNKGAVALYDFDNDGDFDAFWTENGDNQIFRNDGAGVWTPLGAATGIPIAPSSNVNEVACGDIDNDGDIDILLVATNKSYLYINNLNSPTGGVNAGSPMNFTFDNSNSFNTGNRGMGTTMVDIDEDGDLDIYMNIHNANNQLWINDLYTTPTPDSIKNYLFVEVLEDRTFMQSNQKRPALGATVVLLDCNDNVLSGIREVNGGGGRGTQIPNRIHFGLPWGANYNYKVLVKYPNYKNGGSTTRKEVIRWLNPSKETNFPVSITVNATDANTDCPTVLEICDNNLDDDNDGLTDCEDDDCTDRIWGIVFEDQNYGGGVGRTFGQASGVRVPNARVELYDGSGNYVDFRITNVNGAYSFTNVTCTEEYYVRVVNSSVQSQRPNGTTATGLIPVLTYKRHSPSSSFVHAFDYVGGEDPTQEDAPANITSLSLNLVDFTINGQQAQAVSRVVVENGIYGSHFGFNFNTVVNTNSNGQGSLKQVGVNMGALGGETQLTQAGFRMNNGIAESLPAGYESTIFMISDGNVHGGLRAGLTNELSGGVAQIGTGTSIVHWISSSSTGNRTIFDGTTQTYNIGNTLMGALGTGGTVGVDNLPLCTVQKPEVKLNNNIVGFDGVQDCIFRGFSIYNSSNIELSGFDNTKNIIIEQNILGSEPDILADGNNDGQLIRSFDADSVFIRNNLIGYGKTQGIFFDEDSDYWIITCNEIFNNGIGSYGAGGVHIETNCVQAFIEGNLIRNNNSGISLQQDGVNLPAKHIIQNNTIRDNEFEGIRTYKNGSYNDDIYIAENKIYNNRQGILINEGDNVTMTQNLIYNNTNLGVDLNISGEGAEGIVTPNDANDADANGGTYGVANEVMNFPVLQSVTKNVSNVDIVFDVDIPTPNPTDVSGYRIEFFANSTVEPSGHGEGEIYLGSTTISNDVSGQMISFSLPSSISSGYTISATTTEIDNSDNGFGSTSEFSGALDLDIPEICNNNIDDDGDGFIDCADTDCKPIITNIAMMEPTCTNKTGGEIVIIATGSGTLEYSVKNEAAWQSSNTFTNLGVGQYTIRVKNGSSCETEYLNNPVILDFGTCIEICNDGIDNDGDGLIDCDDSDCEDVGSATTINNN